MILKAIVERGIICYLLLVAAVGQMLCLAVNILIKHNLKYLEKMLKNKIIIVLIIVNNYSSSLNGLWVNSLFSLQPRGYWLRAHSSHKYCEEALAT